MANMTEIMKRYKMDSAVYSIDDEEEKEQMLILGILQALSQGGNLAGAVSGLSGQMNQSTINQQAADIGRQNTWWTPDYSGVGNRYAMANIYHGRNF